MAEQIRNQQGATAIMVALVLFLLCGMAALAIDIGNLMVVRNELRNASDAGTLAGARFLYSEDGRTINPGANQIAHDAAEANKSQNAPVEVNWTSGNSGDVQRGHWSFATRSFTPNASLAVLDLWKYSEDELDSNPDFINAVRVVARRQALPAASFFARIFGHESFQLSAESVAYIGFAGSIFDGEADVPIAICQQVLDAGGPLPCTTGRMLNSGSKDASHNTAGWTNFSQPCRTANANEMKALARCGTFNPQVIYAGQGLGATGGVQAVTLRTLIDECWKTVVALDEEGRPTEPWDIGVLPVIDCPGNNVSNCATMTGVVGITILFITGNNPDPDEVPYKMGSWNADEHCGGADVTDPTVRWGCFVDYFDLKDYGGTPAAFAAKSIYFKPECKYEKPTGGTGGKNFGVLARIPVLVK